MLKKLVQTMGQAEKRYFKLFTQSSKRERDKRYFKYFEALAKEKLPEEYNEANKNKIAFTKNYLYESILKSLRNYYAGQSKYIEIHNLMCDIHILNSKGLKKAALKRIQKAKKIAKKHHYELYLFELSVLERRIIRRSTKKKTELTKKINMLIEETEEYISDIIENTALIREYDEIFLEYATGNDNSYIQDEILERKAEDSSSFNIKINTYSVQSMYCTLKKKPIENLRIWTQLLKIFEENSRVYSADYDYMLRYIGILNNYSLSCSRLGKNQEVEQALKKFDTIKPNHFILEIQVFQAKYNIFMLYHLKQKNYTTIISNTDEIEHKLNLYRNNVSQDVRLGLFNNIAVALLLNRQADKALDFINKILNHRRSEIRSDILASAKILQILSQFDLGNYLFVKNLIPSYRNNILSLKMEEEEMELQLKVIEVINNVASIEELSEDNRASSFLELKDYLVDIKDVALQRWLQQKISPTDEA